MKNYVFIHAIGNNDFEKFIEKTLDGASGENFNAFYIPEDNGAHSEDLLISSPKWPSHTKSIMVAFEGNDIAFEGGFTRNAISAPYFLNAQEENVPEKLYFIQVSYLQKISSSSRALFSATRFIEKADGKRAKQKTIFSDTVYVDGKRAPMYFFKSNRASQPHNEAHIRGSLNKIKYLLINREYTSIHDKNEMFNQFGNLHTLHQIITNKRNVIVSFPNNPENIKLLNNFIDIEIMRGSLALKKIAHLQKMLKYHEVNPTIDTNQEMQLSFSYKMKKSQYALNKSLITEDDLFLMEFGNVPENQKIWIDSQKTKIQKEIADIYLEIEEFSNGFKVAEDSPLKSLKSTAEKIQAVIYSASNQDELERYYEQEQSTLKSWEESAKINLQLRSLIKQKVLLDLQKEISPKFFNDVAIRIPQLREFNLINILTLAKIQPKELFEYLATKKLDYAVINIGSIFLRRGEENAMNFLTIFSEFDKEFQKSILENAIQNFNYGFLKSILNYKSKDPAYSIFSAICNDDFEKLKNDLEKIGQKAKSQTALLKYFSQNLIIPFDTPLHLATMMEKDLQIPIILETIPELKVDPKNSVSETPLHIASRNGSLSTAKVLISHESRALMTSQQYPVCATHLASERGYTDMLEILKQVTSLNCRGPNSQTPTFLAIKNRHTKTAEFIIKNLNFYSLGSKSSDTQTLKEIAAKNSDHESLKLLIDYSVPNKKLSDNQFSSLHYSAQNGDTKSTILLLESVTPSQRKIDLERLSDGKTPLIVAIMNNRYEVTKILLDNSPFDVDKPFDYQSKQVVHRGMVTPLQASILNRNLRITKLLLSSGKFDVTKTVELTFDNPELGTSLKLSLIDLAIIVNSFEIFNLLLKNGVEVSHNIQSEVYEGINSLHLASSNKQQNPSIVKALVESGKFDIETKCKKIVGDESSSSALDIALQHKNFEVAKFLLSKNAVVHPELYICKHDPRIMEFLLEKGLVKISFADLSSFSEAQCDFYISEAIKINCPILVRQLLETNLYKIEKIIHHATEQKNPEIFNLLLEKIDADIDVNIYGIDNGITLLHNAIQHNNLGVVKILLEREKIDINLECKGKTPIKAALENILKNYSFEVDYSIVKALLDAKPNIELITQKNERELLLHIASENGNLDVVKSLLEKEVKDVAFKTINALQVAIIKGNNEIAKLLVEKSPSSIDNQIKIPNKNYNLNAIGLALYENNLELLEIILSKNKDLIRDTKISGKSLIEIAIEENKLEAFKLLIEKNEDCNYYLGEYTVLGKAILHKRLEMVKFLVETERVDVNDYVYKDPKFNALQFIVCSADDTEILKYLLGVRGVKTDIIASEGDFRAIGLNLIQLAMTNKKNPNPILDVLLEHLSLKTEPITSGFYEGLSTFQFAILYSNKKIIDKYLSMGEKIDKIIEEGQGHLKNHSVLGLSFNFSREETIKELLNNEQIANNPNTSFKHTDIQILFKRGFMEAINIVFEKFKIDPNIINQTIQTKNFFGLTLLQFAIIQNNEKMVSFLLSKNATVSRRITEGEYVNDNSIHLCIKNSENINIFNMLLPHSDLAEFDSEGLTPIHLMVKNFKYKFMEICLEREGVNPDIHSRNSFISTPLHMAVDLGDTKMVEILLSKANVIPFNQDGLTPLHLAVLKKNHEITKILTSHPQIIIDTTISDGDHKGYTAFQIATLNEDIALMEILLKHDRLDINKPIEREGNTGPSPLELAVYLNKELALKTLLNCKTKKIDVEKIADIEKNRGYTPLYWTIKENKTSMVKQLVNAGASVDKIIESAGEDFGLTHLQYAILNSRSKELVIYLMKNTKDSDFDKVIEDGKYKGHSTKSIIEDKEIKIYDDMRKSYLEQMNKPKSNKRIKIESKATPSKSSRAVFGGGFGLLSEAGAGAGAGSWTEEGRGSSAGAGLANYSFSLQGHSITTSIAQGSGANIPIPAIIVNSNDRFSEESLYRNYIRFMEDVNYDFKRDHGEAYFKLNEELFKKEYEKFTSQSFGNLNEYLLSANIESINTYKESAEADVSRGKATNDVSSIYLGFLKKKHLQFIENEYKACQAFRNQDQTHQVTAPIMRQQLEVSTNSTQITAQTLSNPAQNLSQPTEPSSRAQIRRRNPDNDSGKESKKSRS